MLKKLIDYLKTNLNINTKFKLVLLGFTCYVVYKIVNDDLITEENIGAVLLAIFSALSF